MKTWYEGHDDAYKKKKSSGEVGWATPQETEENDRILKPLLKSHVSQTSKLLELGCGAGDLTEKLLAHTNEITGVDISITAINWAKSKSETPEFLCANLLETEALPQNHFDIAVDSCLFHCIIGEDRMKILKNLHIWLKPNGKFILYTMCGEPIGVLKKGFCSETRNIVINEIATRHIGIPEEIIRTVESCNFTTLQQNLIENMLVSVHQCKST